jgi:hypothetical protein
MTPVIPSELANLVGSAGLIAVLVWFARRFLDRWEDSQRELIAALTGAIKENNELLLSVRSHLQGDTGYRHHDTRTPPNHPHAQALD